MRQSRAGSSHHFPMNQFHQAVSSTSSLNKNQIMQSANGENIQMAMPVTALILPNNIISLATLQHQHHQQQQQIQAPCQLSSLEMHSWFHGRITRKQAEQRLENRQIGSFLVRQSESGNANDFSLSLISGSGCVHMRICMKNGEFILGQCSQPFTSIVKMIDHYGRVEVPIKGALHVKLTNPVARSS
jgi:hypothetical protein